MNIFTIDTHRLPVLFDKHIKLLKFRQMVSFSCTEAILNQILNQTNDLSVCIQFLVISIGRNIWFKMKGIALVFVFFKL